MTNTTLLHTRNHAKSKKPTFLMQDAHKVKSLPQKWKAPRGIHSKMRKKLRGYRRQPSIGWSSPRAVRFLTPQGNPVVLVSNTDQIRKNTPITIARTVGLRKKIEIVKKAIQLQIPVLNVKDPAAFLKKTEEAMRERKELGKKKEITTKKEEPAKKEETKKEETLEEKEQREKEERRKILEQR